MSFKSLAIEDELAIRSLFARYGHFADVGDPRFVDLFAEDATWTRENSPPATHGGSGLPAQTLRGREAMMDLMVDVMQKKFKGLMHHQMTDFYVEPADTPDQAHGYARALITDWRDGPGKIAMFGTYTSTFVRTEDGWKIKDISVSVLPKSSDQ